MSVELSTGENYKGGWDVVNWSEREVMKLKKIIYDQDKKVRADNVVIRGYVFEKGIDLKVGVENLFREKLGLETKVKSVRGSGSVIVVSVDRETKMAVMKNKSKLRGSKIFIENDLSFEDRKKQKEIRSFVREKREAGWNMRAGEGSIFVKGRWWRWEGRELLEKKLEQGGINKEAGDRGKDRSGQNFLEARNG